VSAYRSAEIIEEYEDGYASQVRYVLDAGIMKDEYTLAYAYAEAAPSSPRHPTHVSRIEWHLVKPSSMQRSQRGSYDIADNGDGSSTVTYTLEVDLALPMLGMFKRKAEKMIMDTALKELKRRVETLADAS
jgi:hypothetical protein